MSAMPSTADVMLVILSIPREDGARADGWNQTTLAAAEKMKLIERRNDRWWLTSTGLDVVEACDRLEEARAALVRRKLERDAMLPRLARTVLYARRTAALALVALLLLAGSAWAANTATATLTVTFSAPVFGLAINPSSVAETCTVPAGTVVSNLSVLGGDGKAVTYTLPAGTTSLAISGATVVVAAGGVVAANCTGLGIPYSVTATQP